jgi:uncharacterized membrane protein YqgA involved in biofilm formation
LSAFIFQSAPAARFFWPDFNPVFRRRKLFSLAARPRHHPAVIGAFLNALGILVGALFGLAARRPLSARAQNFFKAALGAFTVFYGLRLIVENVHGTFATGLQQLGLAGLATVLGCWLGKILRLQKISNRLGHQAATLIAGAQKKPPGRPADGLAAATLLFCAAPLGILGAVADALSGFFYLLLLKAVMDGLAMVSFVKMFRWPAALAAAPDFLFLNGLTVAVHFGVQPWLDVHGLTGSVNLAAGLVACIVSLVIFEVRRVELANYLPALIVSPALCFWLLR